MVQNDKFKNIRTKKWKLWKPEDEIENRARISGPKRCFCLYFSSCSLCLSVCLVFIFFFYRDGFFFAVKEVSLLDQGSQGKQNISYLEQVKKSQYLFIIPHFDLHIKQSNSIQFHTLICQSYLDNEIPFHDTLIILCRRFHF